MLNTTLSRTSTRNFDKDKKVPERILKKVLLAGIRAPSAENIQPRTFIVVKDQAVKERLFELCENQAFMKDAPVWIVVCVDLHRHLKAAKLTGVDYDYTGVLPYTFGVLDTALSLENMVIAAEALELGSVIIGSVIEHPKKSKRDFKTARALLSSIHSVYWIPEKEPWKKRKMGLQRDSLRRSLQRNRCTRCFRILEKVYIQ
jgi:nitroreductase